MSWSAAAPLREQNGTMSSTVPTGPESPRSEKGRKATEVSSPLDLEIPPMIQRAQEAFFRDLSQLLKKSPGKWVAYHGDKQLIIADTDVAAYEECLRLNIADEEIVVRCVEPESGMMMIGPWVPR
jgi:hypothetical protein